MNYGTYGTPGEILKRLIKAYGNISENELARQTELNQPTINRILRDQSKEPKNRNLKPLADYFGISLSQMRGEEPIPDEVFNRLSKAAEIEEKPTAQEPSDKYTIDVSQRELKVMEAFRELSEEEKRHAQWLLDALATKGEDKGQVDKEDPPPAKSA